MIKNLTEISSQQKLKQKDILTTEAKKIKVVFWLFLNLQKCQFRFQCE